MVDTGVHQCGEQHRRPPCGLRSCATTPTRLPQHLPLPGPGSHGLAVSAHSCTGREAPGEGSRGSSARRKARRGRRGTQVTRNRGSTEGRGGGHAQMGSVEEPRSLQTAGGQSPGGQPLPPPPPSREGSRARTQATGTELPGREHWPTQHPGSRGSRVKVPPGCGQWAPGEAGAHPGGLGGGRPAFWQGRETLVTGVETCTSQS